MGHANVVPCTWHLTLKVLNIYGALCCGIPFDNPLCVCICMWHCWKYPCSQMVWIKRWKRESWEQISRRFGHQRFFIIYLCTTRSDSSSHKCLAESSSCMVPWQILLPHFVWIVPYFFACDIFFVDGYFTGEVKVTALDFLLYLITNCNNFYNMSKISTLRENWISWLF